KARTHAADHTRRKQRMTTKRKKVVVDPNTLQTQYLGKQRAQQLLPRTARHTRNQTPNLRRRQRTAVKLPVRRQRQTIQNNDRRRHQVVGRARPNTRPHRRRTRSRSRRQNNIANKLLATRPIQARDHNSLRHAFMPQQRCLDLPRLNAEAANLNLMVRAPHKLQNPIPAPARQIPAAVHPAPRSTKPIRNKALPPQPPTPTPTPNTPPRLHPATPNIPTTNPSPRDVKLPNNPNRHRLQTIVQYINPVVGQRTPDRDARIGLLTFHSKSNCIDRGFGRTVKIGDARNLEMARNLLLKRGREDLTSQHQVVQRGVVRSTGNDRVQIGRYATHKSDVIPDQLMPELSGRFPYRVTDDDRCPAPDERQQRLLDRSVKSTRNDKRGSEAAPHVKVTS